MTMITDTGYPGIYPRTRAPSNTLQSGWNWLERHSLPAGTRGVLDDEKSFSEGLSTLSETHLLVLALIARGQLNKQIAYTCGIAQATVKSHVSEILRRLKARSRTEAAVKYAVLVERRRPKDESDA